MAYKYITDNNLYEKQNYMYSEYRGLDFVTEYLDSREEFLNRFEKGMGIKNKVQQDLAAIFKELKGGKRTKEILDLLNAYTKSFEVRKRIYSEYDSSWKPLPEAGFENYDNYLLFASCLLLAYKNTNRLKYFNCLLKVNDTLLSVQDKLEYIEKEYFSEIIRRELDIFNLLAVENGINRREEE